MKTLTAERGVVRVGVDAAGALRLWHLLSLDAPAVAAVWTVFVARVARVALPWSVPAAMFVAVWAVYAADRLLDAGRQENLEERHRFHGRHRWGFVVALVVACCGLLPLIVILPIAMLRLYAELGGLLAGWLGVIHLLPRLKIGVPGAKAPFLGRYEMSGLKPGPISETTAKLSEGMARPEEAGRPIPKEIAVGVFFGVAIFVPSAMVAPSVSMLAAALVVANLCSLNCLFIYAWEHSAGGGAHASTRFGLRWFREIAMISVMAPLFLLPVAGATGPILIAASLAAVGLLALDGMRGRMERTTLRAAADAALLTPLLLMPFLR